MTRIVAITLALAFSALPSFAGNTEKKETTLKERFAKLDTNSDGSLSLEEFKKAGKAAPKSKAAGKKKAAKKAPAKAGKKGKKKAGPKAKKNGKKKPAEKAANGKAKNGGKKKDKARKKSKQG